MGTATPPVQHWGTMYIGRGEEISFHHRLDPDTPAGAYVCGICDRIVVRGMGAWWNAKTMGVDALECPMCPAYTQDMAAHMAECHSEGETDWAEWARREIARRPGPDAKLTAVLRGPVRRR